MNRSRFGLMMDLSKSWQLLKTLVKLGGLVLPILMTAMVAKGAMIQAGRGGYEVVICTEHGPKAIWVEPDDAAGSKHESPSDQVERSCPWAFSHLSMAPSFFQQLPLSNLETRAQVFAKDFGRHNSEQDYFSPQVRAPPF